MATLVVFYIGLSCLVAYLGRDRKFGFWGYLAAALIFDPIIAVLLVLASDKKAVAAAPAAPVA